MLKHCLKPSAIPFIKGAWLLLQTWNFYPQKVIQPRRKRAIEASQRFFEPRSSGTDGIFEYLGHICTALKI